MAETSKRIAVVSGGNRGIGFETCRQLGRKGMHVILGSRNSDYGETAAAILREEGLDVVSCVLDLNQVDTMLDLKNMIQNKYSRIDVLINNAGVLLDSMQTPSVFDADIEIVRQTMEVNVYGALELCQSLIPMMQEQDYGRVVNVSSGMGQLSDMNGGHTGYRLSKAGINVLTRIFSDEVQGYDILINSVCPGWVQTDMGGKNATRTPEEGSKTIVWLATLPKGGPTGKFFRDNQPIPW